MLPGKKYSPGDIIRIAKRRWWLCLLPFAVGSVVGVVGYRVLPVQYRSETLIMVIPQRVPDSYVRSTVTAKIEDRLPSINDQIQSRSRLERIITDFDLYKGQRARGIMENVVEMMRGDIQVDIDGKDLFRVSYKSADPATAQKVTERLASLYIEENLRDRENLAESTSSFIESQLVDAKRRLLEQEKKLEEDPRQHAGQLPSQVASNLQAMQSAQLQLQSVGESINRARERRLLIERQLVDAETLPVAVVVPGSTPDEATQLPVAQQLENARSRLEAFKVRFTKDHPDIRALERNIRELEARAAKEAEQPLEQPLSNAEAGRKKRIGDLQAELAVVDRQIATGQADEVRLRRTIGDYQAKLDLLPTRESELVELTRDYSTLQESYASLLTKQEESKLAANLERRQIGEQFRILDAASLPERPYNERHRLGVLAGGALGGFALGIGLIVLLEYRDSSFKTEEDVLRVLTLPVLALVPVMASDDTQRQGRRRKWFIGAVSAVIVLGCAAALTVWGLRP